MRKTVRQFCLQLQVSAIELFYSDSLVVGRSKVVRPEGEDVCFRGLDSRCFYSRHVCASSFHGADVHWVIDFALLHHHDSSSIWNMDDLYNEPVQLYTGSVSILRVSVCTDLDLPGDHVHEHTRCRNTVGTRYSVATGPVSVSRGSMFSSWSVRYDQT